MTSEDKRTYERVVLHPGRLLCPDCGTFSPTRRSEVMARTRLRYHICPACKLRFKSLESLDPLPENTVRD